MKRDQYDPAFIYPPDIQDCKKHRLACRIFKGTSDQTYDFHKCKCCGRSIGDEKVIIPKCYDPVEQLIYLGPGVPLMFIYMRMVMVLLTIFTLVFGIYALYSNLEGSSCSTKGKCDGTIFQNLSIANKIDDSKSINIQNYLLTGFIFLYVFVQQFFIYTMRKADKKTDALINSPSDYSLLVSQLPPGTTQRDLLEMVHQERHYIDEETRHNTSNLSIKQILMSVELSQYLRQTEEQEESFMMRKKQDPDFEYQFKHIPKPTINSSFAIIIFNQQYSKDVFDISQTCYTSIRNCLFNMCLKYTHFRVKDQMVVCQRAPEPDDILWENADKPRSTIIRNKIISYAVSICLLVLGGYIQYVLQIKKQQLVDDSIIAFYNILSSVSIAAFNFILSQFLVFMTAREGDCTMTNRNSSVLIKTSLVQFFNAGIFYTFARILAQRVQNFNIQGNQSYEITLFMAINAVGPTTANIIITKLQFPTCIQRYLFLRGCLKYNQKKANKIFQAPQIQFPLKYTYMIRTIWLSCFYATFVPLVLPISVFGLLFFYFSQVILFRNDYAVPFMVSRHLVDTAIWLLRYTAFIALAGGFLVVFYISYQLDTDFTVSQSLIISLAIIFMPNKAINKKLFKVYDQQLTPPTYAQAFKQFTVTYKGTNPLSTYDEKMKRGQVMASNILKIGPSPPRRPGPSPQPYLSPEYTPDGNNPFSKLKQNLI